MRTQEHNSPSNSKRHKGTQFGGSSPQSQLGLVAHGSQDSQIPHKCDKGIGFFENLKRMESRDALPQTQHGNQPSRKVVHRGAGPLRGNRLPDVSGWDHLMEFVHFDEAKIAAEEQIQNWLGETPDVKRALIVWDLLGKCRLALWANDSIDTDALSQIFQPLKKALDTRCRAWWSGDILLVSAADKTTQLLFNESWEQAHQRDSNLAILDRHRSRTMWFQNQDAPIWQALDDGPPIVVFYSFKGGLGRSTILASFAIQRARMGERVCVLDFDLDSPGVGNLLSADTTGLTASWGIADFLLESDNLLKSDKGDVPLSDYYHRCDRVAGEGEISVFPAGKVNESYADKLARVDMETDSKLGLEKLLGRVRNELGPKWILVDARTGISDSAGLLLSGIAHLHVILGTTQDQSWQGLHRVIARYGEDRIERGQTQSDMVLVHAMVPADQDKELRKKFNAQSERKFSEHYYASPESDKDNLWSAEDMESSQAPHIPIRVSYDSRLASFGDIEPVADILCQAPYSIIAERISDQFKEEESA